jgi:hypothetical protein
MFATNSDLLDLIPTVFNHGIESWTPELVRAENDLLRKIQAEWYNNRYDDDNWDPENLVALQWKTSVMYRALGYYIMPRLTQWRSVEDAFKTQMEFYQARYAEELDDQFQIGIQYDYNSDSVISDSDIHRFPQDRLWR